MSARTAEELRLLTGPEFNALLAADPELKRLEGLKFDHGLASRVLLEILNLGDWRIGKLPVRPLTAAKWSFLWMIGSPLVKGGKAAVSDIDVALYVISRRRLGDIPCPPAQLPAAAAHYTAATGLSASSALRELQCMIDTAFQPLSMLPPGDSTDEEPAFDGVWCAEICALAARESGATFQYAMHEMSLSAVCALFVGFRRREDKDARLIRRCPDPEIQTLIDRRVDELAEEFLRKTPKCDPV